MTNGEMDHNPLGESMAELSAINRSFEGLPSIGDQSRFVNLESGTIDIEFLGRQRKLDLEMLKTVRNSHQHLNVTSRETLDLDESSIESLQNWDLKKQKKGKRPNSSKLAGVKNNLKADTTERKRSIANIKIIENNVNKMMLKCQKKKKQTYITKPNDVSQSFSNRNSLATFSQL